MRKCYLGILFVLLVVFWAGCTFIKPYHIETDANKKLVQFPEKIPGAYKVIKLIETGAEHCLVHILNLHFAKDLDDKEYRLIKDIQQNNYSILKYLISEISLRSVYREGKIADLDNLDQLLKAKNKAFEEFLEKENIKIPKEIKLAVKKEMAEFFRELKNYKTEIDAAGRLEREGLLNIFASERAFSYIAHLGATQLYALSNDQLKEDELLFYKKAKKIREDNLLDIIHNNKDIFAVVVYGLGHHFEDNIYEWNIKKPADKFSLIVIIPKSLEPYLKIN